MTRCAIAPEFSISKVELFILIISLLSVSTLLTVLTARTTFFLLLSLLLSLLVFLLLFLLTKHSVDWGGPFYCKRGTLNSYGSSLCHHERHTPTSYTCYHHYSHRLRLHLFPNLLHDLLGHVLFVSLDHELRLPSLVWPHYSFAFLHLPVSPRGCPFLASYCFRELAR